VQRIAVQAADEQIRQLEVIANEHAMEFYLAAGFEGGAPAATPLGGGLRMHLDIANAEASTAKLLGEETLLGSWTALAALSHGAHILYTHTTSAAVFPSWTPLNNAILLVPPSSQAASIAAGVLKDVYAAAGVTSWALWLPSRALHFDAEDEVASVDGMARDTTTLVMTRELDDGMPSHPGVLRTTVEAANHAGDQPLPADALPAPDETSDVDGWVLVSEEYAVAGAWTYRDGVDVGVYTVGTAPNWRRRGLARALMLHVLADAYRRGARTTSLQSTRMGEPLYARLGFRSVGRYEEWVPAKPRADEDGRR
jgi:GNAT superfamily N-acetyltransferase